MIMSVTSLALLIQWVKGSDIALSCGVGCRCSLDLVLLWLWHRSAAAALIRHLAWKLPYALGSVLKKKNKQTKKAVTVNMQNGESTGVNVET